MNVNFHETETVTMLLVRVNSLIAFVITIWQRHKCACITYFIANIAD